MSLTDPQSIKIGETTSSLPRVSTGNYESTYESADGLVTLKLSTQESTRKRQVMRVDLSKITADPFIPAQNVEVSMSCYMVIDRPLVGFTNADAEAVIKGFVENLSASTYANAKKLLAGES